MAERYDLKRYNMRIDRCRCGDDYVVDEEEAGGAWMRTEEVLRLLGPDAASDEPLKVCGGCRYVCKDLERQTRSGLRGWFCTNPLAMGKRLPSVLEDDGCTRWEKADEKGGAEDG